MPFGPFALRWMAPSPNPPLPTAPLPPGITRSYISTPSGPLEVLSAIPEKPISPTQPSLFFAHGGFGCAEVWLNYMLYFSQRGYPCYAISYRGHGKSWYPGFWRMYFTSRQSMAEDLVAGIKYVEGAERLRRMTVIAVKEEIGGTVKKFEEDEVGQDVKVILIAHSAGGALSQYVLSKGMVKVSGFCMFAAVPAFGSWKVYSHWALQAPFNMIYRLFHPRYLLATLSQIHTSFFTPSTPCPVVQNLANLLSPYESMLWPLSTLNRFVTGPDVLSSITGWRVREIKDLGTHIISPRLLVLAAENDVLCTPRILKDAADRYRHAFRMMFWEEGLDGLSKDEKRLRMKWGSIGEDEGVMFRVVRGLGHHLQNHADGEWEQGANEVERWVERL